MKNKVISYDYSSVIPLQHLEQANALVSYLQYYPFQRPTHCKHCDSTSFREKKYRSPTSKRDIQAYFCHSGKKVFSQTTNTHFAKIIYLELFADFARLRFAGHSQETISNQLGFAVATAKERDKLFLKIMAEKYPELYTWWKPHQDFLAKQLSPQTKQEQELFIKWLKTYLNKKVIVCPYCHKKVINKKDKIKVCTSCHFSFKQEVSYNYTPKEYVPKWLPFVQGLIEGKSGYSQAKELNISKPATSRWKLQFIKQMRQFKFEKLIQWISWQQSRGIASITKQSRELRSK